MNKVFILGAGASRELKFFSSTIELASGKGSARKHVKLGALSSGFFYHANELFKETSKVGIFGVQGGTVGETLKKMIVEFYSTKNKETVTIKEIFENKFISEKLNIEELYIWAEDFVGRVEKRSAPNNVPSLQEMDFYLAKTELLKYIYKVFSTVSYFNYSIYHKILATYIEKLGGDVISFNWDILLEEDMYSGGTWDYRSGYGFDPVGIIDKNDFIKKYLPKKEKNSRTVVLKPHGSINWYRNKSDDDLSGRIYLGIPLTREGCWKGGTVPGTGQLNFVEFSKNSEGENEQLETLMVPPGKKRKKFKPIWQKIKILLENADEIIAVGFSFNRFEPHVIEEFNGIELKETASIKIINPEKDIVSKYRNIFKIKNVIKVCDYFSEYCKWIANQKGMEDLIRLVDNE